MNYLYVKNNSCIFAVSLEIMVENKKNKHY